MVFFNPKCTPYIKRYSFVWLIRARINDFFFNLKKGYYLKATSICYRTKLKDRESKTISNKHVLMEVINSLCHYAISNQFPLQI